MKRLVTAAAVMIAASALTWAQGESNAPAGTSGPRQGFVSFDERFKQMDKNGNGVIDKDEFKGPAEVFAQIDADNSGTITKDELQAFRRKNMSGNLDERFKQMDKNGNGVIDKDEFKGPAEMFAKIDADNSGTITKQELQAFGAKHGAAPHGEAPKPQ